MPQSYTLSELTKLLDGAGIPEAADEAAILLSSLFRVSRASLMSDRRRAFSSPALDEALKKRLARFPLQFILGTWDFGGCSFTVDEHCLIPRPDTEVLVEEAVSCLPRGGLTADLCTGSGCIAVTLLHHRPDLTCAALELYPGTLSLAVKNAERNGVRKRFIPVEADLLNGGADALEAAVKEYLKTIGKDAPAFAGFDAILSNPPYIRTETLASLAPELSFEPRAALDGGEDGLVFYKAILSEYARLLKPGGALLLEISFDQADDLRRLAEEIPGWHFERVVRDLGGRDRVCVLTRVE